MISENLLKKSSVWGQCGVSYMRERGIGAERLAGGKNILCMGLAVASGQDAFATRRVTSTAFAGSRREEWAREDLHDNEDSANYNALYSTP